MTIGYLHIHSLRSDLIRFTKSAEEPTNEVHLVQPILLFAGNGTSEGSQQTTGAQVEEGGGWFGINCDEPRKRRRGGWLKALIYYITPFSAAQAHGGIDYLFRCQVV